MRTTGFVIIGIAVAVGLIGVNDGWVECGSVFSPKDRGPFNCQGMDARQAIVWMGIIGGAVVAYIGHNKETND